MHGKQSLNKLLTEKTKKPNRSSYRTNSNGMTVGNWRLYEDADGNLVAQNAETGTITIVGLK